MKLRELQAFQARKSLGQNFLFDENMQRKIVAAISPQSNETIVEIGPGFGAITRHLLDAGCDYVGVELDQRLLPALEQQFGSKQNFRLRNEDIRILDLATLSRQTAKLRLVGNIPYHITSSIIFKALENRQLLLDMVLLMQKEVAERVVAAAGTKTYGILSVVSQVWSRPQLLFTVSPKVFTPRPDVDSALVRWDFNKAQQQLPEDADFFRELVRTVFQQRRKKIRNTLRRLVHAKTLAALPPETLTQRPEDLTPAELISLCNHVLQCEPSLRREQENDED